MYNTTAHSLLLSIPLIYNGEVQLTKVCGTHFITTSPFQMYELGYEIEKGSLPSF